MEISAITSIGGNNVSALASMSNMKQLEFAPMTTMGDLTVNETEQSYAGATFADILTSAVENVKTTDVEKNELEYLLAVGELDNPAELTIATTKAQTAVELLTQLRTRTLDSYNELIRMSI